MVPALLMAAGLVLDGGRQLQARRDAGAAAAAAARAASAAVRAGDLRPRARPGPGRRPGERRAGGAGRDRLGRRSTARRVVVTVTADVDYLILPGGALRVVVVERDRRWTASRRERRRERRAGATLAALAALLATALVVVGVPVLLVALVGNPWPGRSRVELGDELAIVVGVLAVLAWLVWLRFVVAVVVEVRAQLAELPRPRHDRPGRSSLAAPARSPAGVGLLAQRLVAAILLVLPVAARAAPGVAAGPTPLRGGVADAALVVGAVPASTPAHRHRRRPRRWRGL